MKKIAIIILALFGIQANISAQCSINIAENEFGKGPDPRYIVEGSVTVTLLADAENVDLKLNTDFDTRQGPDIKVYLANSEGKNAAQIRSTPFANLKKIYAGDLDFMNGNPVKKTYNFEIPNSLNIEDYDIVYFYCLAATEIWDFAFFEAFTTNNCNVLNIEDKEFAAIGLAQNPVNDVINITNPNQQELEIRIFDTAGNLVVSKDGKNQNNQLDVSSLSTGLYVVELQSGTSIKADKLVIR